MILKELDIKNFRSYYGLNHFEFSEGLTLILGDNGDGKTTFFDAIQWVLENTKSGVSSIGTGGASGNINLNKFNISEKRKEELSLGESDEVCVMLVFNIDGSEKCVKKSFTFSRTGEKSFHTGNVVYQGYEEGATGREAISGKVLVDRWFDAFQQRFSLFKGETDLKVFEDPTALKQLVDRLSEFRKFDTIVEYADNFSKKACKAYKQESTKDEKVANDAKKLNQQIDDAESRIKRIKEDVLETSKSIAEYQRRLSQLEEGLEASERFRNIEARLDEKKKEVNRIKGTLTRCNYSWSLLDNYWILCAFPSVLKDFQRKCSALSKEKRTQERDFDKQQAAAISKLQTIKEVQGALINGATELPWYLPDQETMEDMLKDHICKVCNREAPEGSEAYHYMSHKLEQYKLHVLAKLKVEQEKKSIEDQNLFKHQYIEELHDLSIALSGNQEARINAIPLEIQDRLSLDERLRGDLKKAEDEVKEAEEEKDRIVIQAGGLSEDDLKNRFGTYKELNKQEKRAYKRLEELNDNLRNQEDALKNLHNEMDELSPSSSKVKVMRKINNVMEEIAKAVSRARNGNFTNFIETIEERANYYLSKLSANDFRGRIVLTPQIDGSIETLHKSSNGAEVKKPSESQRYTFYMAVLFAISDLRQMKSEEDYPLIFDAPTSSFGNAKGKSFYKAIGKLKKQCIIVTKDFIADDGEVISKDVQDMPCPVLRIRKAQGFDPDNLATISTSVEIIKE